AGAGGDVLDPVLGDDAAVVTFVTLPDADAAIAAIADRVAADGQPAAVEAEQAVLAGLRDGVGLDASGASLQREGVAGAVFDRAVADLQILDAADLNEGPLAVQFATVNAQ